MIRVSAPASMMSKKARSVGPLAARGLPSDLWGKCSDDFFLRVDMAHAALPRWIEPAQVAFMPEQLTSAS